MDIENT